LVVESGGSLHCLQELATGPCPTLHELKLHHYDLLIPPSTYHIGPPNGLIPSSFFLTEVIFSIHVLLPAEVIFFTWNTLLFFSGDNNYKISSLCCNLHPSDLVGQNMHLLAYVNVLTSFLKNHIS